ncbi:MAG: CBS domain-containing protein [Flavobacteriales bacterium]|nr:CBS domain-containing protein [Flavobacteriales bacterium]
MRVEEIMNTPVVITQKTIKVLNLKDRLDRKGINAIPVIDGDGSISGIVSSSDIVACHDESLLVKDIMSDFVHVLLPNNRVKDAAKIMVKHGVHHLVVMEDGKVMGMLSSMDVMKVYAELT